MSHITTETMTANELSEELRELNVLAAKNELTPRDANRMREIKYALANIRDALRPL